MTNTFRQEEGYKDLMSFATTLMLWREKDGRDRMVNKDAVGIIALKRGVIENG